MDFNTLNSVLPLEMINKIVYTHKGLTHPTAEMIKPLINQFEWMNGDYKTLDEKNKEEEGDDMSYFLFNQFHNFGFEDEYEETVNMVWEMRFGTN
tara:strand:- start:125 stop:409 length:285 start_codon:yes stop_codon:yes gene_type:complete